MKNKKVNQNKLTDKEKVSTFIRLLPSLLTSEAAKMDLKRWRESGLSYDEYSKKRQKEIEEEDKRLAKVYSTSK